ncbi:hypothetical protein [Intrasporangium chromatireducens]|uniref:hypothetical protein n=1 Tax=Intrasporangium chromatireducens TaxID=1386088 RepID=UPI0004B6397E|nr:hypothetical protein [Intrasporangium chromatireducens]
MEEVETEIRNSLAFESFEGITDPLQVMAELAERALATERALAARVNDLAQDDRLRYKAAGAGTEQLRAEVALWERWHKQAAHLADRLAGHNFEERRTRVTEQQGAIFVEALRAIFARLTLTPEQQALLGTVVPEELRRVGAIRGELA